MERILKGWNFMRVIRLLMGLYILAESIRTQDWLFGFAGFFLTATAVWNIGCCGVSGCRPLIRSNAGTGYKEVIYEEVDI